MHDEAVLILSQEWHAVDWVDRASQLAEAIHKGQTDKNGEPYIDHVRRVVDATKVAIRSEDFMNRQALIAAAWLHDVVEDSDVTVDDIRHSFSDQVSHRVHVLTRQEGEVYADYIKRISRSRSGAVLIKIADLRDNRGRPGPSESLMRRYDKALKTLSTEVVA